MSMCLLSMFWIAVENVARSLTSMWLPILRLTLLPGADSKPSPRPKDVFQRDRARRQSCMAREPAMRKVEPVDIRSKP